ncbi:MAG TPA: conjugal transfer protein [Streptosporangiaceae bacterium]|nr:conjugal transfer protein [Streptosporangiaceae bacterium]
MATGNEVLPGAPVTAERTVAADHLRMAGQATGNTGHLAGRTAGQAAGPAEQPWRKPRKGAGGRWVVWLLRAVLWTVLLLIGYRGVAAIVTGDGGFGGAASGSAGQQDGFPVTLAQAYALQFGRVYLNFSPDTAARRARELAAFLPPGTDPGLGWSGTGTQVLESEQVAGVQVRGPHSAVVTLLAAVRGQLFELGVPIFAANGGLVVSGLPALLPPPAAVVPPASAAGPTDQSLARTLTRVLPAFFRAFASGDATRLRRLTVPGVRPGGLGGSVTFGAIASVDVPAAGGSARHITVAVDWLIGTGSPNGPPYTAADSSAQLEMTYAMTVVRRGGRWYVQSIGASDTLAGPTS